jgi:NDP-sugar pyrophosphorylase family protein
MSGFGERFRRANYTMPKPMIDVLGKPIIQYVCEMFPGETDFLFICNEDHLKESSYQMRKTLEEIMPTGKIVGIPSHKLGPVHAVMEAIEHIDLTKSCIVNYCDFTCDWDWNDFKRHVQSFNCDGSIPAYRGFHPHSLGNTQYAYIQENDGWAFDIKEKEPFTENRMREYASSGTYYFRSGALMKESFEQALANDWNVNGEFYVSLAYKHLFTIGHPVTVYPLDHFMQWGTPGDLEEYIEWARIFSALLKPPTTNQKPTGSVIVPMAGLGQRFKDAGYTDTKPLIPVSGKPMVEQSISYLPRAEQYSFVLRQDMQGIDDVVCKLTEEFDHPAVEILPKVTEGQAITANKGLNALLAIKGMAPGPITFGVCDCGVIYDPIKLNQLLKDEDTDIIVWAVRGHTSAVRNPQMFGWIEEDKGLVRRVSVKKPLKYPKSDPIITGIFSFTRALVFQDIYQSLIDRDGRVNGEFYLDSCIDDALRLGYCCRIFEVDHYISWGTPDDYETFRYWQDCFDGWHSHEYQCSKDPHYQK